MRYAAIIEIYEQVSPDDFDKFTTIKEITSETTISDLVEWQKSKWKHWSNIQGGKYIHVMRIQEMQ